MFRHPVKRAALFAVLAPVLLVAGFVIGVGPCTINDPGLLLMGMGFLCALLAAFALIQGLLLGTGMP